MLTPDDERMLDALRRVQSQSLGIRCAVRPDLLRDMVGRVNEGVDALREATYRHSLGAPNEAAIIIRAADIATACGVIVDSLTERDLANNGSPWEICTKIESERQAIRICDRAKELYRDYDYRVRHRDPEELATDGDNEWAIEQRAKKAPTR